MSSVSGTSSLSLYSPFCTRDVQPCIQLLLSLHNQRFNVNLVVVLYVLFNQCIPLINLDLHLSHLPFSGPARAEHEPGYDSKGAAGGGDRQRPTLADQEQGPPN